MEHLDTIGILWFAASVPIAIWVAWLMLRCRLGCHEHPMLMERAKDDKGRDNPYAINWRCPRCMRLSNKQTVMLPKLDLKVQIHRDRKAARVLQMRKRA